MHIAYITETWPPEVNGVALTVARTVDDLRRRGHRVAVVRPRRPDEPSDISTIDTRLMAGCPIPRYPELRFGWPARTSLERAWRPDRPDLVHVATEGPLGWSAVSAARALGIPVSSDFRTRFDAYGAHYAFARAGALIRRYLRAFHRRTDLTCVPTSQLRDELDALGLRALEVHPRGVDAALFSPHRRDAALRARWGVMHDAPVALYVGRIAPEKNLALVLDAFEAMRRATAGAARLVLVGDGPWRVRVQRQCPHAILAGVQRGEALATHYASADVFLFASVTETFGNVTLEAMASGLSVVAYDTAAARVLIRDGIDGRVVAPGDRAAFIDAAVGLARDAALRERFARAARRAAVARDWDTVLARFERSLLGVVARCAS